MPKRPHEDDDTEPNKCARTDTEPARTDTEPARTAALDGDTMIEVRQRGTKWTPQAVSMEWLRATESDFVDSAIDLETLTMEIPEGTVPTQRLFVDLFTQLGKGRELVEAWDHLGFHKMVTAYLDRLRKPGVGHELDGVTLYRWGKRFHRLDMVNWGLSKLAQDQPDAITTDMMPSVVALLGRYVADCHAIDDHIRAFYKEAALDNGTFLEQLKRARACIDKVATLAS